MKRFSSILATYLVSIIVHEYPVFTVIVYSIMCVCHSKSIRSIAYDDSIRVGFVCVCAHMITTIERFLLHNYKYVVVVVARVLNGISVNYIWCGVTHTAVGTRI